MKFNKPPVTLPQQLAKWQSRGLVSSDTAKALHYLRFIGYYRFSAYTLPFQDLAHPGKHFRRDTTFDLVLALYVFDRELRLLVLDAIERVEVAVRACLVNEMCIKHGAHWFMDKDKSYPVAIILHYLIRMIAPQSRWHERLASLMVKHSAGGLRAMGFPLDWRSKEFWGLVDGNYSI